jgi:hypothetical protein
MTMARVGDQHVNVRNWLAELDVTTLEPGWNGFWILQPTPYRAVL